MPNFNTAQHTLGQDRKKCKETSSPLADKQQKMGVQQGLEMRGFWFQKKTVQLKTALREVYSYVLKGFFIQKTVHLQGFCAKSAVQNPRIPSVQSYPTQNSFFP